MSQTPVPITTGSGAASVAAELVAGTSFQQVEIYGAGGSSVLSIAPDGSLKVSVIGTITTTAQQGASVSGTVGASVIGTVPVSQVTSPWNIAGSVAAFQAGMQITSISGIVQSSVQGTVFASIIGTPSISGTVLIGNTSLNVSGSVAAWLQSTNASVITVGTAAPNQSVSGTVQVDVRGSVAVAIISGSIAASFTPPANQSVSGTVQTDVRASVGVVIIGGSILTSSTANQSVSGTVGASIIGTVPVTQSGSWTHSVIGTYPDSFVASTVVGIPFMFKANISSSVMQAVSPTFPLPITVTGTVPPQSVSGTVGASLIGQLPAGVAMLGSIAAYQGSIPWTITSEYGNISGSVVAFQGTSPWNIAGSVAATQLGVQVTSIAGGYAIGSQSVVTGLGVQILGLRNDTLSSTFGGANAVDGQYQTITVGSAGEQVTANSPLSKWVQGTADFRAGNTGASVVLMASGGTSIFTYVTGIQIANMGSASVLVTLVSSGSILGYSIAPAGGGSNILYPNALKTPSNGNFAASISGIASVLVSAQGFVSKT